MNAPAYRPLSRDQLDVLMAPGNEELRESWDSLTGALHGTVAMMSDTSPRPLYWNDAFNRQRLASEPARLRGTPFSDVARENVRAAETIERMWRERGHAPDVQSVVNGYLDALLDEFEAIRLYPEIPPARDESEPAGFHRVVAVR